MEPVMRTTRVLIVLWAALGPCAADSVVTTRSDHSGNHAIIMQSTSGTTSPMATIRKAPGFVIIEQRGDANRAVIIQQR